MKRFNITVNGKIYEVDVEEVSSGVVNSAPAPIERPSVREAQIPQAGTAVNAPMPGTIKKISVKVGDTVHKGTLLCVLEAMKMENELMAPSNGKIVAIHASEGDNVNTGTPLISID